MRPRLPSDGSGVETYVWILLPCLVAAGSAALSIVVMQSRLDSEVARQKEALFEARALLVTQQRATEARIRAAEEEARRKALEEFLAEIRVDERSYLRTSKTLFKNRKTLVVQERVYFRNLPLTSWARHEYAMDEGSGFEPVTRQRSYEQLPPEERSDLKLIVESSASTCP